MSDEKLPPPRGVIGVAIDGEIHNPFDKSGWTPAEYREMRQLVRIAAGHPDIATLADPRVNGEVDLLPAVIYVVRRRTDETFTYEQAEKLAWDDDALDAAEQEAFAAYYEQHPDEDPRQAADANAGDDGEGKGKRPPAKGRRKTSAGS